MLRRWIDASRPGDTAFDGIARFNAAVDQAIAESVSQSHDEVGRVRDLLLGVLGHDLRSPLNTIVVTASHLARLNAGADVSVAAARPVRSGYSMRALLDDLVDFNRTRLGLGLNVTPPDLDLAQVLNDEPEQLRDANPHRQIDAQIPRAVHGRRDGARLKQVLRNLVLNAVRHGAPRQPITVQVQAEGPSVTIA